MRRLLVQDAILQVGLREGRVHLVDFLHPDVLGNDAVAVEQGLALHASLLSARAEVSRRVASIFDRVGAVFVHHVRVALGAVLLLVNETEADVVLELRDREVQLVLVAQIFEQQFGESTDDRLLVVVDDILEKLIDELHFEVRQVESGVVVAIEGVGKVQNDPVSLVLAGRVQELVNPPTAQLLDLLVAGDQAIKFKLLQIGRIQVRYTFILVGNNYALKICKLSTITYLFVGEGFRAVDDGHVPVLVNGVLLFLEHQRLRHRHRLPAHVVLRVHSRDEEPASFIGVLRIVCHLVSASRPVRILR